MLENPDPARTNSERTCRDRGPDLLPDTMERSQEAASDGLFEAACGCGRE